MISHILAILVGAVVAYVILKDMNTPATPPAPAPGPSPDPVAPTPVEPGGGGGSVPPIDKPGPEVKIEL